MEASRQAKAGKTKAWFRFKREGGKATTLKDHPDRMRETERRSGKGEREK